MNFFFLGKVVETQKLSLFSLGLLPVFSTASFVIFSLPLLFMAVILLESKQSVVWNKVCGFSWPIIMAAAESEESHRAVGELLLPSPSPFVAPYSDCLFLLTSR